MEVRVEELPDPQPGQVLVQTLASAISAGTEMLYYRGQVQEGTRLDMSIRCLQGSFHYPFKFGYANVGKILALGKGVSSELDGKVVFSFHPHESHYLAPVEDLIAVPEAIDVDDALFLPSMETALSLIMDGEVTVGENVIVLGQGIIGLLTTSILSMMPLNGLVTVDRLRLRRELSLQLGAHMCFNDLPAEDLISQTGWGPKKADLTFEVSGDPMALQYALDVTGLEGRIVVGSWYGSKGVELHLGEVFHRNRIKIISSQVSSIGPRFSSRWDKRRRLDFAWKILRRVRPSQLITHRINIDEAPLAFELIDEASPEIVQVVLTYE